MPSSYYAVDYDLVAEKNITMALGGPRPRLMRGTRIVVFKRSTTSISFVGTASVIAARISTSREGDDGDTERQTNIIEFSDIASFEKPRPLTELAGSLHRVYRFLNPYKHFKQKVNALGSDDFNTIVDFKLQIPRSIFRYLFSSLPLVIQSEFVRTYPGSFPRTADGYVTAYAELAQELLMFLEDRVREPLELISDVARVYQRIKGDSIPKLSELYLMRDRALEEGQLSDIREGEIAFGIQSQAIAREMAANPLFSRTNKDLTLLQECSDELNAFDEEERRWRDPIF